MQIFKKDIQLNKAIEIIKEEIAKSGEKLNQTATIKSNRKHTSIN